MIMEMAYQNAVDHDNHFHLKHCQLIDLSVCIYVTLIILPSWESVWKNTWQNSWWADVALESSEGQVSFVSE